MVEMLRASLDFTLNAQASTHNYFAPLYAPFFNVLSTSTRLI
jgi:hypothetical protein